MKTKTRCNPKLKVDLVEVARLFATSNLSSPSELHQSRLICSAISAGEFGVAKKMMDDFARPEYGTSEMYFRRKQFVSLLSKVPFAGSNKQRKDAALSSFFENERRCKRTNKRLAHFLGSYPNRMPDDVRVALSRAKEYVRQVLGRFDESRLEELIFLSRPGSGVAIGTQNRYRTSLPFKLSDTTLCTTVRALPYAQMLVEGSPSWFRLHAEIDWGKLEYHVPYDAVHGNRFTFVPKDARTLRTIAIEPALNVCLQLGVHSYIARRLKSFGNSIDTQERNQNLAAIASVRTLGESYSTLDLANASDTVSTELIRYLLPSSWFEYLDDIRSHAGIIEGTPIVGEKFSSMGNGFTFALETLVFLAVCKACQSMCNSTVPISCFGDDIIIPDRCALLTTEVLKFCGFVINHNKSFYFGNFRESCGADWHSGDRVTPQYIKKAVLRPTDVYLLLNRADPVLNWGPVREYLFRCHKAEEPILFGLENEDPSSCMFAPFDYVKGANLLRWSPHIQNWTFKGWAFKAESEKVSPVVGLAAALFGAKLTDSRYSLRGRGSFRLISMTPGITRGLPRFLRE